MLGHRNLRAVPVTLPNYDFQDEFNGTTLDTTKWLREAPPYAAGIGVFSTATDLVTINGQGQMVCSAKKRANGTWECGLVSTGNLFRMKSGTVEIKAKLSTLTGSWPAFWFINTMDGSGLGNYAEIDIMEIFPGGGVNGPGSYFTIHDWNGPAAKADSSGQKGMNLPPNIPATDGNWHVWKLVWTTNSMELFIDDVSQGTITPASFAAASPGATWPFSDIPLKFVINHSAGTTWGVSPPDAGTTQLDLIIDYVRIIRTS